MTRYISTLVLIATTPIPAGAQALARGNWTGTLTLSNGVTASMELTVGGDVSDIRMRSIGAEAVVVTDLRVTEREVTFAWGGFLCALAFAGSDRLVGDCATGDGSVGELALAAPERGVGEDVLSWEQLRDTRAQNLYEALRRLRPYWIRVRGPGRRIEVEVHVYVESQSVGGVDALRTINLEDVGEVRYFSGPEATTRFGTNNEGGAIVITLRRGEGAGQRGGP